MQINTFPKHTPLPHSFLPKHPLTHPLTLPLTYPHKHKHNRYAKDEDLDVEGMQGIGEDSGWKQVHGDVFRAPDSLVLFSSMLGTGWQLLLLVLAVILYAMAGPILHGNMYEDRGEMVSTLIVCYALSSAVGGYVSGGYYK